MGDKIYFINMIISTAVKKKTKTKHKELPYMAHAINPNSRKLRKQRKVRDKRNKQIFFDHFEL